MNVLITGANRGIGLAFVRQYAAMGATVFAACRNPDAATDLWHLWEKHTEHLYIVQMNVTDADSIGAAQANVSAQTKQLNRLINNAAIFSTTPFHELTPEESLRMFAVNSVAPVMVTRTFFDMFVKDAVICNISSNRGSISGQIKGGLMDYAASKAALNSYTRSIAALTAENNMKAVMIDPGWVQTRMGGENAALTPDETVRGIINVIETLTPSQNGAFLNYDGTPHPW